MSQCAAVLLASSMIVGQAEEKQAPKTTIPQEVLAEFEFLVGKWKADFIEGEITGKGKSTVRWSIDKQAVVQEQAWDLAKYGQIKAVVLVGWDTAKQELVEANFFSGGGGAVRRYKLKSPGLWVGEAQHFHPDGTPETSKVRIERKSPDEYAWIETDRSDKSQENAHVHFRRVKK